MTIIRAIVLGILQGATEFIPVSSSGHLVLVPWLLGWGPPGLTFSVTVHLGTAVGVLIYFWKDWLNMMVSTIETVRTRTITPSFRLLMLLVFASIPAGVIGLVFHDAFAAAFEEPLLAAVMLFVTAGLLAAGEVIGRHERTIENIDWVDALLIGIAQAIAIIPGISRSGATITGARLRHMEREDAARFSFLLATPIIIAAGALEILSALEAGLNLSQGLILLAGFASALISAYIVIRWLLTYLKTHSTHIFSIYCVVMGIISLFVFFIRG